MPLSQRASGCGRVSSLPLVFPGTSLSSEDEREEDNDNDDNGDNDEGEDEEEVDCHVMVTSTVVLQTCLKRGCAT